MPGGRARHGAVGWMLRARFSGGGGTNTWSTVERGVCTVFVWPLARQQWVGAEVSSVLEDQRDWPWGMPQVCDKAAELPATGVEEL